MMVIQFRLYQLNVLSVGYMAVILFSFHSFSVGLHHKLNMLNENQKYCSITQFSVIFHFCSLVYRYRLLLIQEPRWLGHTWKAVNSLCWFKKDMN